MAAERVADMTIEELKAMVAQIVEERVRQTHSWPRAQPTRPVSDVLESMQSTLLKSNTGEPSAVQLLFEEREQWNNG
jgi:hypothetical protein